VVFVFPVGAGNNPVSLANARLTGLTSAEILHFQTQFLGLAVIPGPWCTLQVLAVDDQPWLEASSERDLKLYPSPDPRTGSSWAWAACS